MSYLELDNETMRKCNLFWTKHRPDMEECAANDHIIYKLNGPRDALTLSAFLSSEQKLALFDIAVATGRPLDCLLSELWFECETTRVCEDESYQIPTNLTGTFPHCGLYGIMLPDGSIHT